MGKIKNCNETLPVDSRSKGRGLRSTRFLIVSILSSSLIRFFLFWIGSYKFLIERAEVASPVSSFKRLAEGLVLEKFGLSAYAGDAFHQPPLLLALFQLFPSSISWMHWILFIAVDICVAIVLREIAIEFFKNPTVGHYLSPKQIAFKVAGHPIPEIPLEKHMPNLMATFYLFNPLVVFSCLGLSMVVFNNLAVVMCLLAALKGNLAFSTFSVALASYLSIYPIVLIFPVISILSRLNTNRSILGYILLSIFCFGIWLFGLLYLSFLQQRGSWDFIREVYGFHYWGPDLSPNIGLFWYYMTECFTELRPFFTFLYQYQLFIYIIPLSIRFWKHPVFLFWAALGVISILKPYLTVGDIALHIAFLPLFHVVVSQNSYNFVAMQASVIFIMLSPVLWQMWLYQGDGNPNYYYGMTLIFALIHGWLFTDTLQSALVLTYKEENPTDDLKSTFGCVGEKMGSDSASEKKKEKKEKQE